MHVAATSLWPCNEMQQSQLPVTPGPVTIYYVLYIWLQLLVGLVQSVTKRNRRNGLQLYHFIHDYFSQAKKSVTKRNRCNIVQRYILLQFVAICYNILFSRVLFYGIIDSSKQTERGSCL